MPNPNPNSSKVLQEIGHLRWTVIILVGMIVIMAYATYIESQEGHAAAMAKGFHSIPMDILIFLLAVNITACTIMRAPYKIHQIPWLITHVGILLTMSGAIISHRTTLEGQILLRTDAPVTAVSLFMDSPVPMEAPLKFTLELDSFQVKYYPGTGKASDYVSYVRTHDHETGVRDTFTIRVNHPLLRDGWNISQASFIPGDDKATILGANRDPGTPVSYAGFLVVFLGMAGIFFLKPWLKKMFPPPPKSPVFEEEVSTESNRDQSRTETATV